MSDSKKRRRKADSDDVDPPRRSLVDYSKISNRHMDDSRYEKHKQGSAFSSGQPPVKNNASAATTAVGSGKMSSQMDAVYRLMTGKEERTIAEKLADSNRPTWEQYKKDNEDKLDITGVDRKKMEEYRQQLDKERDKILSRGRNHKNDSVKERRKGRERKHRHSSDDEVGESDDDSSGNRRKDNKLRKREFRKKSKKHRKHHRTNSRKKHRGKRESGDASSVEESADDRSNDSGERKRQRNDGRKEEKAKKGSDDEDDSYRLSSFFNKGSSDEESC